MNDAKVREAISEAKRFIKAAEAYRRAEAEKAEPWHTTPKESGAVRRASMDLTRALAEMRKPG